ncbi:MAG: trpD [Ferruginibacter sp.]|nr:trpD [Ferruginibacter sp.]
MKKILQQLFDYKTLTRAEARSVLVDISRNAYSETEISAFITVYLMRSITLDELEGFKDALLELALPVDLGGLAVLDIVGTGGDGKNTFNISTLSSFIVAGTGNKVAKHGNYAASSISGSSNLMEQLGYSFSTDSAVLQNQLATANICFLHAPLFHPALKAVSGIRKSLGVRTFFNMLGPLVNPAGPAYQLIGVFNLEMARLYNYLFQQSATAFTIIHSLEGYDEISLTGDTRIITRNGERIASAETLGKRVVSASDIYGGHSPEESAAIFLKIIKGQGTWAQNAVVIANAAMALSCTGKYPDYEHCYQLAVESLESGNAYKSLQTLIPGS